MERKRNISLLFIIFIISLFLSYHIYNYCITEFNKQKVDNYLIEYEIQDNYRENNIQKIEYQEKSNDYLGVLLIPKLNFKQGFYNINDNRNDVNQNIEILKGSLMPDIKGSSLVIAGHKGESYLGYFNNLDKLSINDELDIFYHNKKYQYTIFDIYELEKNGKISFTKNIYENYLVLTTCSKKDNRQLIVVAKLVNNAS
jgi:LPXTG-site transpeptidase (sortase) family protein